MKKSLLGTLALVVASTACQPPAQEAAGLSEEDVAAITKDVEEGWVGAMKAGDLATLAAMFTEDAVNMPENEPAHQGREAIKAWLSAFDDFQFTDLRQTVEEIAGRDDLAYVRGAFSATVEVEGEPEPIESIGKFIEIRRKQPDGTWLIAVNIVNSDLPLPEQSAESEM